MSKSYRSKFSTACAFSIAMTGITAGEGSLVHAQEFDEFIDELPVLEEIIVTARKRQESIQDSPVAVSALSADALKEAGITNTRDLQETVPGLMFTEQGKKNPSIYIRGVGQRESVAALDPGVGVYINGIYIPRTDSQMLDALDTQSIQVLRGPQGTLFGKNNTGGAILFTTAQPHTEALEGYITSRLGNFGRRDLIGAVNIPLNEDTLAARLSATSIKRDGYMKSVVDGKEYGDQDRLSASARVLWQVSDEFSVDFFSFWSQQNETGAPFTCFFLNPNANVPTFTFPGGNSFQPSCERSEQVSDQDKVTMNGPSVFKLDNSINSLTLAWEFDDFEIKSVTAINNQDDITAQDDHDATDLTILGSGTLGLTSIPRVYAPGPNNDPRAGGVVSYGDEKRSQFSQELQLIGSAFDERLQFTVGAFYAKEKMENVPFTSLVGQNSFAYLDTFGPIWGVHTFLGTQSDLTNETIALFAQGTYDIYDWWQITLGGRYTIENRERTVVTYDTDLHQLAIILQGLESEVPGAIAIDDALADLAGFLVYPSIEVFEGVAAEFDNENPNHQTIPVIVSDNDPALEDDESWKKFTPTFTSSFNIPEDLISEASNVNSALIYFTFSRGFKSGGFENKGGELVKFEPEIVDNFEIGFKLDAFENRMRFNAALYHMNYDDIQVRIAEQGATLSQINLYIGNAGKATIEGMEFELAMLPVDNLTITATGSYTDAKYDEFTVGTVIPNDTGTGTVEAQIDRSDEDFGSVPQFTASLVVSYDWATDKGMFIPRFTAYHSDKIYTGIDYLSPDYDKAYIDAYTLFNLRLAYIPTKMDNLNVTMFINNLADKDYYQGGFTVAASMGSATLSKGPPRTYGLEATYSF